MSKNIFINILLLMSLAGCIDLRIIEKWDNARAIRDYDRKEKAYYDKETPEQKRLRKINDKICEDISGAYSGNWDQILYRKCMKKRGSPNLVGCDLRDIERWSNARLLKEYEQEEKAFYDKETPEQKRLRKINDVFCTQLAERPENKAKGGRWMDNVLIDCMKKRGSPMF